MDKKLWNYAFSILLSAILLLLLGIFVHLDSNNKVNGKPLGPGVISEETKVQEEDIQDKEVPFLYEIFSKKDEELQLFHQFTKDRRIDIVGNPKVAIIIDDLGYQEEIAGRILNLNFPVAISVLPFLSDSQLVAQMAKEKGMTVLLHLPMEPHNSNVNPGKGAIFSNMNEEEIRNKMLTNLLEFPEADGINNHMGSKVTENKEIMRIVLDEIKERDIFFIDSMTSPDSVGYQLSKEMGIKTAFRSVFLDNEQNVDYIRNQISLLKEFAIRNGSAIAIGHPYCNTIDVLNELDIILEAEGVEIVKLEELLE
ncbi:divergent polysaccharide deacetylase family protein [Thioalkalivibrio sp.]|uniref:divergent polysaccharide deacetylase family protein n=1 Tax=Thioalkalivibrio sp. TaxID=2093813 RepID=UPI003975D35B